MVFTVFEWLLGLLELSREQLFKQINSRPTVFETLVGAKEGGSAKTGPPAKTSNKKVNLDMIHTVIGTSVRMWNGHKQRISVFHGDSRHG